LLTPLMNYIPVRKENYADSGEQENACNNVEDLDDQQFIVHGPNIHATQNKPSEERTAGKEIPLSSEEQVLHDELVNLMHQESLAKLHNEKTLFNNNCVCLIPLCIIVTIVIGKTTLDEFKSVLSIGIRAMGLLI
ncbi:hypothetical protein Tco_0423611, partial [Tanacetum coccineum]